MPRCSAFRTRSTTCTRGGSARRPKSNGRELINFASYDYLGLNQEPAVAKAAQAAVEEMGTSVSASRLVAGERALHQQLEKALADFYETEDCIVYVSGHATNVSTIGALMNADDLIVHDSLMHNSGIMGARLSRATTLPFKHNNLDDLEKVLIEHRKKHKNCLIVTEGLYSMDGDFPDLPRLIEIKKKYGAWLMVDEAHSLGVLGKTGRGVGEHYGVNFKDVDIWMGTLSKTLGSCGGYICGNRDLVDLLKYHSPGFVYSVGLAARRRGRAGRARAAGPSRSAWRSCRRTESCSWRRPRRPGSIP